MLPSASLDPAAAAAASAAPPSSPTPAPPPSSAGAPASSPSAAPSPLGGVKGRVRPSNGTGANVLLALIDGCVTDADSALQRYSPIVAAAAAAALAAEMLCLCRCGWPPWLLAAASRPATPCCPAPPSSHQTTCPAPKYAAIRLPSDALMHWCVLPPSPPSCPPSPPFLPSPLSCPPPHPPALPNLLPFPPPSQKRYA
ncbi:unnamed protein product [Closterium sp. NIES-54]